jgi:SAM-dependent methyltransferase
VLHDPDGTDGEQLDALRSAGVEVVDERVVRVVRDDGKVEAVELSGGRRLEADTVVVGPRFAARAEPFAGLGLHTVAHPSGLGDVLEVDAMGQTSVPGCYAAGNVADPSLQVLHAAAAGNWTGAMVAFDLARDDLAVAARPSANAVDWDHRYRSERVWSGNPNGTLVAEVSDLEPGRVLDVGAGEGGDAVWLAEQGWTVTASDVSERGLAHVGAEADRRGLSVELLHADANADDPFGGATFDLVSAQYASIPRTPDDRGLRNLLDAVAPAGTLLVVGHDPAPMRAPVDTATQSRMFDADAYLAVADIAKVIRADGAWAIEVDELRPRPPGAASASHHVDDVVLRARRREA